MPISLSDLFRGTKKVGFQWEEDDVVVEYNFNLLTPPRRLFLATSGQSSPVVVSEQAPWWEAVRERRDRYLDCLVEILVSWDVLGDDGNPVPISRETLDSFPAAFVAQIAETVLLDGVVNPQRSENSSDSSPQEDSSEKSRPGSRSSKRPSTLKSRRGT